MFERKQSSFFEPGLDNLIKRLNNKKFFLVEQFPKDIKFDAFIVTVGTPLKVGEKTPNFEYIKSAMETLKEIYDGTQLIILRSTVSVGTTRNVVLPFLSELCNKNKEEVLVSMCPERTVEGKAVEELTHLPQIISENNEKALKIASDLFSLMTPCIVRAETLEEAELCKLYCNTFRDMTFAIGNAFCMAAQEFGVDGKKVIEHANYSYPRSTIAKPGFVAGPCLEKDAYILINNMPECDSKNFILAGRKYNESLEDLIVDFVKRKVGSPSSDNIITLSGMAFKGSPETSDLRGSTSVYIAKKLYDLGYKMNLHDFVALESEMKTLNMGTYYNDLYKACENSKLLIVLNNHKKYSQVFPNQCFYKEGFEILDSWGVCTELYFDEKINIKTLGNMNL